MAFKSIYTTYGEAQLTAAQIGGQPVNLIEMAVGDGNGNDVEPDPTQAALVREMYRAPVNRLYQHPVEPNRYIAELIVPADEGGFTMREVGVFDDSGGLFIVGSLPTTYKPQDNEGAYADAVVRVEFVTSGAAAITLQIDPNVAVATQSWVVTNMTAATIIPGGTTGQVLTKASNADGDTLWADLSTANVVVDVIEERQTLAAAQTEIIMAITTSYGLAVYIEGVRINKGGGADEWDEGADETRIVLGQSYPAGSQVLLVQNEPAGSAPAPLERSKNLSDVESAGVSRTNLDVFSKAETRQMAPAGLVAMFARSTAPAGWLKANGAAISRTAYADLFSAIGTTFGAGDGFNTFNLPDLRGEFVRAWDDGRGIDESRTHGSSQSSQLGSHEHKMFAAVKTGGPGIAANNYAQYGAPPTPSDHAYDIKGTTTQPTLGRTSATGGNETRPRNVALLACIKF